MCSWAGSSSAVDCPAASPSSTKQSAHPSAVSRDPIAEVSLHSTVEAHSSMAAGAGADQVPAVARFEQLEGLPLQLIALKLSNPAPLLSTCQAAQRSVQQQYQDSAGFEVQWFLRWAPVLSPHRPWQYAAVTWKRMGGPEATAEVLVRFMLAVIAAQRHAQQLQQGTRPLSQLLAELREVQALHAADLPAAAVHAMSAQAPAGPAHMQNGQQQQAPQPQHKHNPQHREQYSTFPECLPLPSVVRQAQRQLQQGHAIKALHMLCPGPPLLLYPYASFAGNLQLLVQLVQAQKDVEDGPYPDSHFLGSSQVERFLSTAQLCAFGAMRAGNSAVLAWVLKTAGHSFREDCYLIKQLLHFAVRHSNSACLQELLQFLPCAHLGLGRLQPRHQHLAMAAGRSDPWAADVVQLLLQALGPKLTAAKYMKGAYEAAFRSRYLPVMQQLLQVTAAEPQKHMYALLQAAVAAGNVGLLQQLMGQEVKEGGHTDTSNMCINGEASQHAAHRSTSHGSSSSDGLRGQQGYRLQKLRRSQPNSVSALLRQQQLERNQLLNQQLAVEAPLVQTVLELGNRALAILESTKISLQQALATCACLQPQQDQQQAQQQQEQGQTQERQHEHPQQGQQEEQQRWQQYATLQQQLSVPLQGGQQGDGEQTDPQAGMLPVLNTLLAGPRQQRQAHIRQLLQLLDSIYSSFEQAPPSFTAMYETARGELQPLCHQHKTAEQQLQQLWQQQDDDLGHMQKQHEQELKALRQQQRRHWQPGHQQQLPQGMLPQLPLAQLTEGQWVSLLDAALDGMSRSGGSLSLSDPQQDSRQAAMADALWGVLSGDVHTHALTHALVQDRIKYQLRGPAAGEPFARAHGGLLAACASAKPGKLLWLGGYGLFPELPAVGVAVDAPAFLSDSFANMLWQLTVEQRRSDVSVLAQLAKQLGVKLSAVDVFVRASLSAAVSAAVSSRDVEGMQQLAAFREELHRRLGLAPENTQANISNSSSNVNVGGSGVDSSGVASSSSTDLASQSAGAASVPAPAAPGCSGGAGGAGGTGGLGPNSAVSSSSSSSSSNSAQLELLAHGAAATAAAAAMADTSSACGTVTGSSSSSNNHHSSGPGTAAQANTNPPAATNTTAAVTGTAAAAGVVGVLPLWQLASLALALAESPGVVSNMNSNGVLSAVWNCIPAICPPHAAADWNQLGPNTLAPAAAAAAAAGDGDGGEGKLLLLSGHGMHVADAAASSSGGMHAGPTEQEQFLLTTLSQGLFSHFMQGSDCPKMLPQMLQHRLDVLAWVLHPKQRPVLWGGSNCSTDSTGEGPGGSTDAVQTYRTADKLAIRVGVVWDRQGLKHLNGPRVMSTGKGNQYLEQQEQLQLQQHRQQREAGVTEGFEPLPYFSTAAAELSRVLLLQPQFCKWPSQIGEHLAGDVGGTSSEVHLEKVKAMLGVVVGAPRELLVRSWHLVTVNTFRRVTATGDIDLLALLLLYDRRAKSMPGNPAPPPLAATVFVNDADD